MEFFIMSKADNIIHEIYRAAIDAVNPYRACMGKISLSGGLLKIQGVSRTYRIEDYESVYVIGAGKATASMALALEEILGDYISEGVISVKYGYTEKLNRITQIEAAHPVPDENGIIAAKKVYDIAAKAGENDLIISLISGGGSALLPLPVEGISLDDKNIVTEALLSGGASIDQINCIRKHISIVKGGKLAKAAYPATVLNLMISDVPGDSIDVIASGPFTLDRSTFAEAWQILESLPDNCEIPESVRRHIKEGCEGNIRENPDEKAAFFANVTNCVLLSNFTALDSAASIARNAGYNTLILSSSIEGNVLEAVGFHMAVVKEIQSTGNPVKPPACIISGGESFVRVEGSGKGGRNTEFALRVLTQMDGMKNIWAASIATDGTDGLTDAAGAVINYKSYIKMLERGLQPETFLKNSDSYSFFEQSGDLVKTGPTNTNVMDIHIFIVE
ncbi:MAG: glycerate kinase [Spirochaetes bacterium]|nr:glycerate kinase [Spirochaetota bacterium]MBN2772104.1 glycerate kinase [Spirochaetota bacterium]